MTGTVTKSTGSWYRVRAEDGSSIDCRLRGKLKIAGSKATNPVAVGDRVLFRPEENTGNGVIVDVKERKNYIIRKATKLSRQTHVIAANLDQAVIIATLAYPRTSAGFIDRFLVTCEAYSIPAAVVFNKYDLVRGTDDEQRLQRLIGIYSDAGYGCMSVSATEGTNIEGFITLLKGKTSLLSGHSGVGKSALINAIEPGLDLKVQPLSRAHKKGRHTTTFAEMFTLGIGADIIDTPGIKEFGLVDFESWELCHYFPEMRKYFNKCRYDNCTHYNEPGCRIREEVSRGVISSERYDSYLGILLDGDVHASGKKRK